MAMARGKILWEEGRRFDLLRKFWYRDDFTSCYLYETELYKGANLVNHPKTEGSTLALSTEFPSSTHYLLNKLSTSHNEHPQFS